MAPVTEIMLVGGERYRVEGDAKDVEALILDAARGSIMQFAWLRDVDTGEPIGINPDQIAMLRSPAS